MKLALRIAIYAILAGCAPLHVNAQVPAPTLAPALDKPLRAKDWQLVQRMFTAMGAEKAEATLVGILSPERESEEDEDLRPRRRPLEIEKIHDKDLKLTSVTRVGAGYDHRDWMALMSAYPFPVTFAVIDLVAVRLDSGEETERSRRALLHHDIAQIVAKAELHWGMASAAIPERIRAAKLFSRLGMREERNEALPPIRGVLQLSAEAAAKASLPRDEIFAFYAELFLDESEESRQGSVFSPEEMQELLLAQAESPAQLTKAAEGMQECMVGLGPDDHILRASVQRIIGHAELMVEILESSSSSSADAIILAVRKMDNLLQTKLDSNGIEQFDPNRNSSIIAYRDAMRRLQVLSKIQRFVVENLPSSLTAQQRKEADEKHARSWVSNCERLLTSYDSFESGRPNEPSEAQKVLYSHAIQEMFAVGRLFDDAPRTEVLRQLPDTLQRTVLLVKAELLGLEGRYDEIAELCAQVQKDRPADTHLVITKALETWNMAAKRAGRSREAATKVADYEIEDFAAFLQKLRKIDGLELDEKKTIPALVKFCEVHRPVDLPGLKAGLGPLEKVNEETMTTFIGGTKQILKTARENINKAKIEENQAIGPFSTVKEKAAKTMADAKDEARQTSAEYVAVDALLSEWRNTHQTWKAAMLHGELKYDWAQHQLSYVEKEKSGENTANTDLRGYLAHANAALECFAEAGRLCAQSTQEKSGSYESASLLKSWSARVIRLNSERAYRISGTESPLAAVKSWHSLLPANEQRANRSSLAMALRTELATGLPTERVHIVEAAVALLGDEPDGAVFRERQRQYSELRQGIRFCVVPEGRIYRDGKWSGDNLPTFAVGDGEFAVWLTIQHTAKGRSESGGFRRYAQNQLDSSGAALNAKAVANYVNDTRDRLNAVLHGLLEIKHIEPVPEPKKLRALSGPGEGWDETPLYYVVFKTPEGSAPIRRIPSLPTDLNFDKSGDFVVMPFFSAPVAIEPEKSDDSLLGGMTLKQRLLLTQGGVQNGTAVLEITSVSEGLPPAPTKLMLGLYPPGFSPDGKAREAAPKIGFQSRSPLVRVTKVSEIPMRWDRKATDGNFVFPKPAMNAEVSNLVWRPSMPGETRGENVPTGIYTIQGLPGGQFPWGFVAWGLAAIPSAALLVFLIGKIPRRKRSSPQAFPYSIPSPATPLRAVHLLRKIMADKDVKLGGGQAEAILADIRALEASAMGNPDSQSSAGQSPGEVLARWLDAAAKVYQPSPTEKNGRE